jgi:hypothetical protein
MSSRGVRASDARGQTSSILQRADKRQALPLLLFFLNDQGASKVNQMR